MRRYFHLGLGILEILIAIALVQLGLQLPSRDEMENSFDKARQVTMKAGDQIHQVRDQVNLLRRPEMQTLSIKLQKQLRIVNKTLHDQKVDFESVASISDALGGISDGLEVMSKTLRPDHIQELGKGLRVTADFLDEKLIPATSKASAKLDESIADLRKDAELLTKFMKTLPSDLNTVREVYDSLEQFDRGIEKMKVLFEFKRLKTIQEGFKGMRAALATGAGQVEDLSSYTYPVVVFDGLTPVVQQRAFWPKGREVAKGLREAAKGVQAANLEMADMAKNLPEIRQSLNASHEVIKSTKKTLGEALKQQLKVEEVLKSLPQQTAAAAQSLPNLFKELSHVLAETKRFKEVAVLLRSADKELQGTVKSWPKLQSTLLASAKLLKTTKIQMDDALDRRKDYEDAVKKSVELSDAFATMLPLLSQQMLMQLDEQERSLDDLGSSLHEVGDLLPGYGKNAGQLVETGRWLAWLVALAVILHSAWLLAGLRSKNATSLPSE